VAKAERKRPRRTRERILETGLALFNAAGAPRVTTADIADEMNISPGNLYYHFANKEEIVFELYRAFEARVEPLYADPRGRRLGIEDLWLWLHVLHEAMWAYRFLYRDLAELASRDQRLRTRFAALFRSGAATVVEWCRGLSEAGAMRISEREIEALADNVMLIAAYWPSYDRNRRARLDDTSDAGRAAYQVLSLFAPYVADEARAHLERLSAAYL
jgi:AcrR family transcriptional regulator